MSWDTVKGQWKQIKGNIKNKWGKLTDDEILQLEGDKDKLAGKIQEKYGIGKKEALNQIEDFQQSMRDTESGEKEDSWS